MAKLEILNPVAQASVRKASLARRLSTLDGKRIGLLWNGKGGGDTAAEHVGELLQNKYPGLKVELIRTTSPAGKQQLEELKGFDGIIGSTGD